MLISPEYAALNAQLHSDYITFGASGGRHADKMRAIMDEHDWRTALDYGCGKGTLAKELACTAYDPAVPQYSSEPMAVDFVMCIDVMEHVERDCVSAVIAHIRQLALKGAWLDIALRPARKTLPDGRNAHITLESPEWWQEALKRHFRAVITREHEPNHHIGFLAYA
jgi:hypothetical protein